MGDPQPLEGGGKTGHRDGVPGELDAPGLDEEGIGRERRSRRRSRGSQEPAAVHG
jgi:hypothetical protein